MEFAIILSKMGLAYYGGTDKTVATSTTTVQDFLATLRAWYSALPALLSPKYIVYPGQLNIQCIIIITHS